MNKLCFVLALTALATSAQQFCHVSNNNLSLAELRQIRDNAGTTYNNACAKRKEDQYNATLEAEITTAKNAYAIANKNYNEQEQKEKNQQASKYDADYAGEFRQEDAQASAQLAREAAERATWQKLNELNDRKREINSLIVLMNMTSPAVTKEFVKELNRTYNQHCWWCS